MDIAGPRLGRGRHRWAVAAAVGAVAAAASLAVAPPAVAANNYLEFSLDGQKYSSTLNVPLFRNTFIYLPGSSDTATVWVRNNSGETAALTSAAVMGRSAAELNGYLGLSAGQASKLSERTPLGLQGSCADVQQAWILDAGEELELTFVLEMSVDAPNRTMNREAAFNIRFLLESTAGGTPPREACTLSTAEPGAGNVNVSMAPPTAERTADMVTVTGIPAELSAAPVISTAGGGANMPVAGLGKNKFLAAGPMPETIVQAGFQSTVEPVIRSLSGTLLIVMFVVFSAAVIFRLRNRQA